MNDIIYDYQIIGAGLNGLITAYELTKLNKTGIIIEKDNDYPHLINFDYIYIDDNYNYFFELLDELNLDKELFKKECYNKLYIVKSIEQNIIYNEPKLSLYNINNINFIYNYIHSKTYLKNGLIDISDLKIDEYLKNLKMSEVTIEYIDLIIQSKYYNEIKYLNYDVNFKIIEDLYLNTKKYIIYNSLYKMFINKIKEFIKPNFEILTNHELINVNKQSKYTLINYDNTELNLYYNNLILTTKLDLLIDNKFILTTKFLIITVDGMLSNNLTRLTLTNNIIDDTFYNFIITHNKYDINDNIKLISIYLENNKIKFNFKLINDNYLESDYLYFINKYMNNNIDYNIINKIIINNVNPILLYNKINYDTFKSNNIYICSNHLTNNNIDNSIFAAKNLVNNFINNNYNHSFNVNMRYYNVKNIMLILKYNKIYFILLSLFIIIIIIILYFILKQFNNSFKKNN